MTTLNFYQLVVSLVVWATPACSSASQPASAAPAGPTATATAGGSASPGAGAGTAGGGGDTSAKGPSTTAAPAANPPTIQVGAGQSAQPAGAPAGASGGGASGGLVGDRSVNVMNFAQVDAHVYRGGRPDDAAMGQLQALGVRTIVSLEETYFDEEQVAAKHGMRVISVKMVNLPFVAPSAADVATARDALADPNNQPAFVHCYHGADRTGLVVGSYRIHYDHVSVDEAVRDMAAFQNGNMFAGWQKLLSQPSYQ